MSGVSEQARRNERLARQLWQAASEGDPEPVLAFAPDVVWRTHGQGHNAGEYHGIDAVIEYLARSGEGVDDLRSDLIDVLASNQGAVIHYRVQAKRGPRLLEGRYFLWLAIDDDVVTEVAAVPFDQAANDVFWRLD